MTQATGATTPIGHVETRSVLFTDLVGSTELRVDLGEAAADELRRAHDALCADAVAAHSGTVVKGLGDGIMATFDSAADAVAGAIALQQAVERHSRHQPQRPFALRIGCSIGDVSREDGDVFGVPVVEASRLCAAASSGEILVAELVRVLARGRGAFLFEPMGELDLRGLPDPVPACRVLWEPLLDPDLEDSAVLVPMPAPLLGAATAYVGRTPLRERLSQEWASTSGCACRTVLLAGEPGVGKTRTAAELAHVAYADGALVLYGRCDEDLDVPYQPFVEALGHYVRHSGAPVLGRLAGELTRLAPDLGARVESLPATVTSDPASEEYRLFEATASWLVDAARAADGLVLVLDDIHWATKPTLQLMSHVVRRASDEGAPLLLLATYRDTDVDRTHPLAGMLGDLRRMSAVSRLTVDNLAEPEVVEFLTTAAGHELDGPTRALAEEIYAETEGNPFFVGEVLRHLIETGGVRRVGERWTVAADEHVTVPEGVRDVVGRRLSRLSPVANEMLTVAAVLGRAFEVEPLLELVAAPEGAVLDALDNAVRARLVEETAVDHYRFAHSLVRTTLYEELSATRRRRLHRHVADVLEKLRPDDVRALAHHCTESGPEGGDITRALRYTVEAAQQSLDARAFADAEAAFRRALDLVGDDYSPTPELVVAAMCGLGEAQRDQGEPGFRETLLEASRRADELGDAALLERAVLSNTRGWASIIGDVDEERLVYIERALELTAPGLSADRTLLTALLASELTFCGEHDRRLRFLGEAESAARALDDPELLARVLVLTSYASIHADGWAELVERGAEMVALSDATGDPTLRVLSRMFHNGALLTAGRLEESQALTEEMTAIAEAEASPIVGWAARYNAQRLLSMSGRLEVAQNANNDSLARAQEMAQPDGPQWWGSVTMGIAWLRGLNGPLAGAAEEFAEQYHRNKVWRCAQAWVLGDAGRVEEARRVIEDYELDPVEMLLEPWPFCGSAQLGFAAWATGDEGLARRAVEALAPYQSCWAHYYLFTLGPVSWPLAMALAASGRYDEAVSMLDEALVELDERGMRAYAAKTRVHAAQVLRRRAAPGDLQRAEAMLDRARHEAGQVDAPGVVEQVEALRSSNNLG